MDMNSTLARVTRLADRLEGAWLAALTLTTLFVWSWSAENGLHARMAALDSRAADERGRWG